MGPSPEDAAADRIAAGLVIPWDRHGPMRPYLETDAGMSYRVHFAADGGRGPHERIGPSFPPSRDGLRAALALLRAIERRISA